MILEEFDEEKTAVLNPEHFVKQLDGMPKTASFESRAFC